VNVVQNEVFVSDLGSSNGTFVDGTRLNGTALLSPGMRLQIGAHVLEHEFRSRKELEDSKELDRDLEAARRYVQALIPPPLEEGPIRTEWVLLPSARLGGDVFGYRLIDEHTFAMFLIDVSGHGTGAAMHAVSVTNVLISDALPVDMRDPAKVAGHLNSVFQMRTHGGMYLTLWYGVYDLKERRLRYCSAGHHPSYLVPPARGEAIALKTPNIMIGAAPVFPFESASVEVPAGSKLYVFSDGVFEIEAKDGVQWTVEHVVPLLAAPTVEGLSEPERLLKAVREHARDPDFDDDFTVLAATFL
jgi:serine phosphatase RsbU (regulator of sigma subunit)